MASPSARRQRARDRSSARRDRRSRAARQASRMRGHRSDPTRGARYCSALVHRRRAHRDGSLGSDELVVHAAARTTPREQRTSSTDDSGNRRAHAAITLGSDPVFRFVATRRSGVPRRDAVRGRLLARRRQRGTPAARRDDRRPSRTRATSRTGAARETSRSSRSIARRKRSAPRGAAFYAADAPGYGFVADDVAELSIAVYPEFRGTARRQSVARVVIAHPRRPGTRRSASASRPRIRLAASTSGTASCVQHDGRHGRTISPRLRAILEPGAARFAARLTTTGSISGSVNDRSRRRDPNGAVVVHELTTGTPANPRRRRRRRRIIVRRRVHDRRRLGLRDLVLRDTAGSDRERSRRRRYRRGECRVHEAARDQLDRAPRLHGRRRPAPRTCNSCRREDAIFDTMIADHRRSPTDRDRRGSRAGQVARRLAQPRTARAAFADDLADDGTPGSARPPSRAAACSRSPSA